jgi:protein-disulfide isomerase
MAHLQLALPSLDEPWSFIVKVTLSSASNVATLVACVLIATMAIPTLTARWFGSPDGTGRQPPPVERITNLTTSLPKTTLGNGGTAKIALIEFSDFQCPFCGRYARETFPTLRKDFVDTGTVTYAYRHFPLSQIHALARDAGTAAICAGTHGLFWQMHERLFADQQALAKDNLVADAIGLGLDRDQFSTCLGTPAAILDEDLAEGQRLGVASTPTFLIGLVQADGRVRVTSRIHGAQAIAVFRSTLEEARRLSRS